MRIKKLTFTVLLNGDDTEEVRDQIREFRRMAMSEAPIYSLGVTETDATPDEVPQEAREYLESVSDICIVDGCGSTREDGEDYCIDHLHE